MSLRYHWDFNFDYYYVNLNKQRLKQKRELFSKKQKAKNRKVEKVRQQTQLHIRLTPPSHSSPSSFLSVCLFVCLPASFSIISFLTSFLFVCLSFSYSSPYSIIHFFMPLSFSNISFLSIYVSVYLSVSLYLCLFAWSILSYHSIIFGCSFWSVSC